MISYGSVGFKIALHTPSCKIIFNATTTIARNERRGITEVASVP